MSTTIDIFLPPTIPSWSELPANPLEGLSTVDSLAELSKDDFRFYCDSCQKGYNSKNLFDAHLADHIYCDVPGCNFTCIKHKSWKMEMHQEALHNRPDAPDLVNTEAYLDARKKKFPTVNAVKNKVEELYYRAARGELLPDERRRWLRQHGVSVRRQQQNPAEKADRLIRKRKYERNQEALAKMAKEKAANAEADDQSEVGDTESVGFWSDAQPDAASVADAASSRASVAPTSTPQSGDRAPPIRLLRQKLIPMGANGKLTKAQQVQLVREKYLACRTVPKFYVCSRCGQKGHWVEDCPTRGDDAYDRQALQWAEPMLNRKRPRSPSPNSPPSSSSSSSSVSSQSSRSASPSLEEKKDFNKTSQVSEPVLPEPVLPNPVSARVPSIPLGRLAAQRRLENENAAASASWVRRRKRVLPQVQAPSLFDRLVEDDRLNERGLVLQALRFFVHHEFFC